ncbi:transmembrane 4 L6 family member 5 [Myripristis murdjan]|uniref:transmembrane 4 L6 family member 5 n=1 Tax=Myripristis murdjan TaxID=586833 RepID=UPI001175E714|nr:transmembrane 4 L6 family member 5-like [Myripristis murdjan]
MLRSRLSLDDRYALYQMCVSGCLRCVGLMLVPLAVVCMLANVLLLLPGLQVHFLLEGHVTREATWATGLWGSGLLVLLGARAFVGSSKTRGCWTFRTKMLSQLVYSCVCVLAAGFCSLVSGTGLVNGPLCLHNTSSGPAWGVPFKTTGDGGQVYLFERSLWSSVCLQPAGVVQWNVTLFSVLGGASALQTLLCTANILNTLLGLVLGPGLRSNKVSPVSV